MITVPSWKEWCFPTACSETRFFLYDFIRFSRELKKNKSQPAPIPIKTIKASGIGSPCKAQITWKPKQTVDKQYVPLLLWEDGCVPALSRDT